MLQPSDAKCNNFVNAKRNNSLSKNVTIQQWVEIHTFTRYLQRKNAKRELFPWKITMKLGDQRQLVQELHLPPRLLFLSWTCFSHGNLPDICDIVKFCLNNRETALNICLIYGNSKRLPSRISRLFLGLTMEVRTPDYPSVPASPATRVRSISIQTASGGNLCLSRVVGSPAGARDTRLTIPRTPYPGWTKNSSNWSGKPRELLEPPWSSWGQTRLGHACFVVHIYIPGSPIWIGH